MTKIKTVIWRTIDVPEWEVADFLTKANFQPGKFHLLRRFPGRVCIVYVEREV